VNRREFITLLGGGRRGGLITFTFNTVSQGLYIRHGMFPRLPIYNFKVARELLMDRLKGAQLHYAPLEDKASHLHSVAHIDEQALGVSREKHHRYLINDSGVRGVIFYADDNCVGYAYISPDGHVGPLSVAEPKILGASDVALSIAVDHGMRITFPMVLVSTHEFGSWAQYLPRNPGFL